MNPPTLCIAYGFLSEEILSSHKTAQWLALNAEAMFSLEQTGLNFFTLKDLFSVKDFFKKFNGSFIPRMEKAFQEMDKSYESSMGYKYAYSCNNYDWYALFLHQFLADEISKNLIERKYRKTILFSYFKESREKPLFSWEDFSSSEARSRYLLHLIGKGMRASWIMMEDRNPLPPPEPRHRFREKMDNLKRGRVTDYIARHTRMQVNKVLDKVLPPKLKMLMVQGGYEVDEMKPFLRVERIQPLPYEKGPGPMPPFTEKYYEKAYPLFEACLPAIRYEIHDIMRAYHNQELSKISLYAQKVREQLSRRRPHGALYSTGAISISEKIYAHLLNESGISPYYLEHSGPEVLFDYFSFERYVAGDPTIQKKLVLSTEAEVNKKSRMPNASLWVGGYQKGRNMAHFYARKHKVKHKILFLAAVNPSQNLAGLEFDDDDYDSFLKHQEIFGTISKLGLSVDIKLFPSKWNNLGFYFSQLLRRHSLKDSSILFYPRADYLLPGYDLILMETHTSILNCFAFALRKPVICYLKKKENINPEVFPEVSAMYYLTGSPKELESLLLQYKNQTLPSRFSKPLVDRYISPERIKHPAKQIASKILQECAENMRRPEIHA